MSSTCLFTAWQYYKSMFGLVGSGEGCTTGCVDLVGGDGNGGGGGGDGW